MYAEHHKSLLPRYEEARKSGFEAVSVPLLIYDYSIEELKKAKEDAYVEQMLITSPTNTKVGLLNGYAAIPGQEQEFCASIQKAVEYARALKCPYVHVIAGVVESPTPKHDEVYVKNLRHAISVFEKENITAIIEPICEHAMPNYYMNCFKKAMKVMEEINSPRLKLQLDIYHLQSIHGDLTHYIKCCLPRTAIVQVAQVPHRHEPDIMGEVDFHYVFKLLKELKYSGYISLHQDPAKGSDEGLEFLRNGTFEELEPLCRRKNN